MVQPLFSAFGLKACFRAWGAAMAMLLLGASCTQDLPGDDGNGDAAISFSAPAVTRAAVESFQTGDAFSVWGWYDNQGAIGNPFSSETVTNNGSAWSYTGGLRYWVLGAAYDFYAVYPSSVKADCDEQGHITVTDFDASATGDDAVDLMTAKALDITHETADDIQSVGLEFEHLLAKVNVAATVEGGNATVTSIALSGVDIQGTFQSPVTWTNISTGSYEYMGNVVLSTAQTDLLGDLLVIPQTVDAGISLTIHYVLDGTDTDKTIQLPTTVTQWEAGSSYQYTLNIKGNNIIFSVNVTPWGTSMGGIITVE